MGSAAPLTHHVYVPSKPKRLSDSTWSNWNRCCAWNAAAASLPVTNLVSKRCVPGYRISLCCRPDLD